MKFLSMTLWSLLASAEAVKDYTADVLFVLHDAGESLGLQTVIDELMHDEIYSILILSLGEPAIDIYSSYQNSITLSDLGIYEDVEDGVDREYLLSNDEIQLLASELNSRTVVCGMAYAMQAQICGVRDLIDHVLLFCPFFLIVMLHKVSRWFILLLSHSAA
jgi:hypothetical protein